MLVMNGAEQSQAHWPELPVRQFEKGRDALAAALEESGARLAVLQYVGYGYAKNGAPVWLPEALARWKESNPARRVLVMFHELYAVGPVWKRAFWTTGRQRRVVHDLLAVADHWITSCPRYWKQLQQEFWADKRHGRLIPIGANILPAEKTVPRTWDFNSHGKLNIVVFGLPRTRLRALETHEALLKTLQARGWIGRITLLGKRNDRPRFAKASEKFKKRIAPPSVWCELVDLNPQELSQVLLAHDLGLVGNEPDTLTKSGVFAALCAHGVLPVVRLEKIEYADERVMPAVMSYAGNDWGLRDMAAKLLDDSYIRAKQNALQILAEDYLHWSRIAAGFASSVAGFEERRGAQVYVFSKHRRQRAKGA